MQRHLLLKRILLLVCKNVAYSDLNIKITNNKIVLSHIGWIISLVVTHEYTSSMHSRLLETTL